MTSAKTQRTPSQRFVTAVVLGTALSTLGLFPNEALADGTVNNISKYCTACWRNARLQPDHWADCTQEVLTRLLQSIAPRAWERVFEQETDERREFLRAIDAVKKRTQRAQRPAPLAEDVADRTDAHRREHDEQRRIVLQAADQHLSDRQQQIVNLSLDGWSVHEIADRLRLPATRVSDEKYKAIQRLRRELA
jgi:RNA polymerase sigma factor (sigma-70 family)